MNDLKKQFLERLNAADRPSPDLRRHYEKGGSRDVGEIRSAPDSAGCALLLPLCLLGLLGVYWGLAGLGRLLPRLLVARTRPVDQVPVFLILAFCILATLGLALLPLVAGMLLRAYSPESSVF